MIDHARHDVRIVIYWALILSLLINSGVLVYLLMLQRFHTPASLIKNSQEATVIMQEEDAADQNKQHPLMQPWAQTYAKQSVAGDAHDQGAPDDHILDMADHHQETSVPETEALAPLDQTPEQEAPTAEPAVEPDTHIETSATIQEILKAPAQVTPTQPHRRVRPATAAAAKRKITAADIAKGFLNNMRHKGDRAVTMIGDKDARITQEQLKHERYLQKLQSALDRAFSIHRHQMPRINAQEAEARLLLALNKDGSIRTLELMDSSGFRALDLFVIEIFKKAGTAFAPVPDYLPNDPYTISFVLTISATQSMPVRLYR